MNAKNSTRTCNRNPQRLFSSLPAVVRQAFAVAKHGVAINMATVPAAPATQAAFPLFEKKQPPQHASMSATHSK